MRTSVPQPHGVVAVHADGTEEPVSLRYAGQDRAGLHRWLAEHPVRHHGPLTVRVTRPAVGTSVAVDVVEHAG